MASKTYNKNTVLTKSKARRATGQGVTNCPLALHAPMVHMWVDAGSIDLEVEVKFKAQEFIMTLIL